MLLDISSYFIEQNGFLVLARLRERDSEGRRYEIKFYTHSPKELLTHYEDKIYIGRDFVDLFNFNRKYFGRQGEHHLPQGPVRDGSSSGPRPG